MRKIVLLIIVAFIDYSSFAQGELTKLTFGVGLGANHIFNDVYDYSLTTDNLHHLKLEKLNRNNIVVSPVLIFRFGKLAKDDENKLKSFSKDNNKKADVLERLSLLFSTDLINVQSDKISFNKNIDGGIGLGYAIKTNLMIGVFYEIKTYRQLREYIVEQYENDSIPNGSGVFNALDKDDNNLFFNKPFESISIKLIFNFNTLN